MQRRLIFQFICSVLVFAAGHAYGAKSISSRALPIAPIVDGQVADDPAWAGMTAATGFTQVKPFAGQPQSQHTEVFVGFTEDALYIAAICHDEDPSQIFVTDSRRDSSLEDLDSFQVILDMFQDGQNGYVFGTTPNSTEYDGQVTSEGAGGFASGGSFNLNWDTSWTVRSRVTTRGWETEMRIPFKSLRYPSRDVQTWGINFQRDIGRTGEVAYWAPLARQYNLFRVSDAGKLTGVQPPAQRNFKLTPYALGQFRRGGEVPTQTDFDEEFGFDAKYSITPSLTLDVTYNTDFAQVEVDEIQVNLDRFSLFFPEKRAFFLENAGQFNVGTPGEVELFFSRRIGIGANGVQQPIDGGVRLSGKIGDSTNVGLLHMQTDGVQDLAAANDFTVARINQELPNRSSIGAIFVERQGDGSISGRESTDYNRAYAVDGKWGIGERSTVTAYVAKTETPGARKDDMAYRIRAGRDTPALSQFVGYTRVGEDFNPEVGFLRRRNYEKAEAFTLYRYRPADLWGLYELRPHIAFSGYWNDTGYWESGFTHIDNHWEWHNGIEIHTGVNLLHEGVREAFEINSGTFVLPDEYNHKEVQLVFLTDQARPLNLETTLRRGGFFGGDRTNLSTTVNLRQGERFSSSLTWEFNDIDLPVANGDFEVNVARLRLSYSFTPKILLQALVQYDDRNDLVGTNIRFSWLQSANAGLYLVYNEIDDDTVRGPIEKRREFTLKYSRIIDLL